MVSSPTRARRGGGVGHRLPGLSTPPRLAFPTHGLHVGPSSSPGIAGATGSSPMYKYVVEATDSKEYLSRLYPGAHLPSVSSYEKMNYRDLVLGMVGVHSHLVYWGQPTRGYEAHCEFVKRKATSFLYTNMANVLYDRMVTENVIAGVYEDYPSSCGDAS